MNTYFEDRYPGFRKMIGTCILYWIFVVISWFSKDDHEFTDSQYLILYFIFLAINLLLLALTYASDKYQKGQRVIYLSAIVPLALTAIMMLITLFGTLLYLSRKLYE